MTRGIVRRIDELGRVVIPKELRRTMQIREGEELEIVPSGDNEITIKKYSRFNELQRPLEACCAALNKALNSEVLIFDKNAIVAHSGSIKSYVEMPITNALLTALEGRQSINLSKKIPLVKSDMRDYTHQYLTPIIIDSELMGGIIILGEIYDKEKDIVKAINLCLQELIG